ncbi:MAG: amino acid adenylation domain-containing protein, partial [Cyclobacteriaceae bacterium]
LNHSTARLQENIAVLTENFGPLSFAQERLWFIQQYEEDLTAYNIPLVYELSADTVSEGIVRSLQQIVNRHEVLRSTIRKDDEKGSYQQAHTDPLKVDEITLKSEEEFESVCEKEIRRPFDLSAEYPMRAIIYTISDVDNSAVKRYLLLNTHHIVRDGWSTFIFEKELLSVYQDYLQQSVNKPKPLAIQYKDYANWQRTFLTEERLSDQLNYWMEKLSGYEDLVIPTDFERPATINYSGAHHRFAIDPATSAALRDLARNHGVSLHDVMLSSINILLSQYTGQKDVVIGSLNANRQHPQTQDLIGFFVNTQVSRTALKRNEQFSSLIERVSADQTRAQDHQDLPFERLVNKLGVDRDFSKHPVFQVIFTLESASEQKLTTSELQKYLKPYKEEEMYQTARFDMTITINDDGESLEGHINYATALFKKETISRIGTYYSRLLDQLIADKDPVYSSLTLPSEQEASKIINEWSHSALSKSIQDNVAGMFRKQALATPEAVAVFYDGQSITYKELDELSDKLAYHLKVEKNIQRNEIVGIMLNRSSMMIVAILGILKAGGAYTCLDPEYPDARKAFIIDDTKLNILITETDHMFNLEFYSGELFAIDLQIDMLEEPASDWAQTITEAIDPENIAYIIYTSGTTGNPKGVIIPHRAILSLVTSSYVTVAQSDVFAFFSSPSFDASTFEIFTPLLNGNKLVIPSNIKDLFADVKSLKSYLQTHHISTLWLTKTLFENVYAADNTIFKGLNALIIGGEALNKSTVTKLARSAYHPDQFINGYGPTESTTFACTFDLLNPIETINVPIGQPIPNREVYILNNDRLPVPVGVVGELYIGGQGLSHGYLNNEELTKQKFVSNPFKEDRSLLYKTGDLVRWLENGQIEYIGRNDSQVKIRGHRIELSEVDSALLKLEDIRQASVIIRERTIGESQVKYLAAYFVPENVSDTLNKSVILDKISSYLPDFMIPSALIQ